MKANICDCCGCAYSKNNIYKTHMRLKRYDDFFIDGIAYVSNGSIDAIADLCDDCIGDLFDYISSHKKNEVIK